MYTHFRVETTPAKSLMRQGRFLAQHIFLSKVCPDYCFLYFFKKKKIKKKISWLYLIYLFVLFIIEPAKFVKKVNDLSVEKGKNLLLECTYTGTPPISVTWKKNGVILKHSEKCSITTTETSAILEIPSSKLEDQGQYSCHIENDSGQDNCHGAITILGALSSHHYFIKCYFNYLWSLCNTFFVLFVLQNHLISLHPWSQCR